MRPTVRLASWNSTSQPARTLNVILEPSQTGLPLSRFTSNVVVELGTRSASNGCPASRPRWWLWAPTGHWGDESSPLSHRRQLKLASPTESQTSHLLVIEYSVSGSKTQERPFCTTMASWDSERLPESRRDFEDCPSWPSSRNYAAMVLSRSSLVSRLACGIQWP